MSAVQSKKTKVTLCYLIMQQHEKCSLTKVLGALQFKNGCVARAFKRRLVHSVVLTIMI